MPPLLRITKDGSSPAAITGAGLTPTTASFTPPNGSLLVMVVGFGWTAAAAMTIAPSDTGGHTWNTGVLFNNASFPESALIAYAFVDDAPGSITCKATATGSGTPEYSMAVEVLLGCDRLQNGASGSAHNTNTVSQAITPTRPGSQVYGFAVDGGTNAAFSVLAGCTQLSQNADPTTGTTTGLVKATALTTSLASTTYGFTTLATGDGVIAGAYEIVPARPAPVQPLTQAVLRATTW